VKNIFLAILFTLGIASKAIAAAGMAFDPAGNLFLLGANPSTIFKFSPDGAVKTFAEATTPGEDWEGIAIDAQGNVFVATDGTKHNGDVITRILKFTPAGKKTVYVANVADGQPLGLAIDRDGNLFVGLTSVAKPRGPDAIYKIDAGGKRKSVFTTKTESPTFFAFDSIGNLYVSERRKLVKLRPDGSEISSQPSGDIYDLTCDKNGNLLIALPHEHEIATMAPDGSKTSFAKGIDPWFIAIDKNGNVFALDNGIQKISSDGKRTTFAANPIN
jgi:sugar lactone lactonase YvrE